MQLPSWSTDDSRRRHVPKAGQKDMFSAFVCDLTDSVQLRWNYGACDTRSSIGKLHWEAPAFENSRILDYAPSKDEASIIIGTNGSLAPPSVLPTTPNKECLRIGGKTSLPNFFLVILDLLPPSICRLFGSHL